MRPRQHFLGKKDTFSCLAISLDGILEYTEVGQHILALRAAAALHHAESLAAGCEAVAA